MNDPKMMEVMATMQREHAAQVADLEMKLAQAQQGGGELPQDERAIRDAIRSAYDDGYNHAKMESDSGCSRYAGRRIEDERSRKLIAALALRAASVPAQAGQQPVAGQENPQAATYPDQIWLQSGEPNNDDVLPYTDGLELTWCADRQHRTDVLYVRADIAEEANRRAEQLAADWGISQIEIAELRGRLNASAVPAASVQPVDMILHCPACHTQHIDAPDDRTPEWSNPPHRSHLCHACKHIWRPADVATNGVAAITTKGRADSPQPDIGRDAVLMRQAIEWIELTDWVQSEIKTFPFATAGMHRADVMRQEIERLRATQAAPEVASIPDAGDEPVYQARSPEVTEWEDVNAETYQHALSNGFEVRTLYTRPQPAPAVLSDAQIAAIYQEAPGIVSFARAVLAAAGKGGAT